MMWLIFMIRSCWACLSGIPHDPGARIAAAIEVLGDIEARRRPAPDALKDWGLSHRFAGSGDRAAIAGLVYDTLRRRASAALSWARRPRAPSCSACCRASAVSMPAMEQLFDGSRYAPPPLNDTELGKLTAPDLAGAPAHVRGDYPEWLDPHFATVFGDERAEEGAALASRAPLDLRVNTLKARRDEAQAALADLKPEPARWSPGGLRIEHKPDAENPAVHAEPAFIKGLIEIQDEGSQLAAFSPRAKPGEQVVDLCAGGGGKTLALAAAMQNKGQIHATDNDKRRLAPIHDRLARAGARNVQVLTPKSVGDVIAARGQDRSRADRRALFGHRRVAAQSRRQVADAAGRARYPPQGAGRGARPRRGAAEEAAASPMSPVRCWRRRTSAGPRLFGRHYGFSVQPPPSRRVRSANAPSCSSARC